MPLGDVDDRADPETELADIAERRRRARTAAQGVGTSFAGMALVVASLTSTKLLPVLVALIGVLVGVAVFRRRVRAIEHHQVIDLRDGDDSPFTAVAAALVDLREGAAATDALLRRLRTVEDQPAR